MGRSREFSSDTAQLASRIPKALHRRVKLAAIESGETLSAWLTDALAAHLARVTQKRAGSASKPPGERTGNAA